MEKRDLVWVVLGCLALSIFIVSSPSHAMPNLPIFSAPPVVHQTTYFYLNETVTDDVGDFNTTQFQLTGGTNLKYVWGTNTFSLVSNPSGYCTLDAGGSFKTVVSSTDNKLSFKVQFNSTYPTGYKNIESATVYDLSGNVTTSMQSNLFYFSGGSTVTTSPSSDVNWLLQIAFGMYVNYFGVFMFFGILYCLALGVTYIRTKKASITAAVGIMGIPFFAAVVPAYAIQIAIIFLVFALAGALFVIFRGGD
jgi:hypothetical protein